VRQLLEGEIVTNDINCPVTKIKWIRSIVMFWLLRS